MSMDSVGRAPIPALAHFIWLGRRFPWTHYVALRSATERGGFGSVLCHHEPGVEKQPWFQQAARLPGVRMQRLDPDGVWHDAGMPGLARVYAELSAPAARSNLLRLGLLAHHGGVYLDFDTVMVASFKALRARGGFFCGVEPLAYPGTLYDGSSSLSPTAWGAALLRAALRATLSYPPQGWRYFQRVEALYPLAANNAVLGATPGHPLVMEVLELSQRLPKARRTRRYALGTHLLQQAVSEYTGEDLTLLAPEVCFPLGPVVARHWFRHTKNRGADLDAVLRPNTCVVHWYASGDNAWAELEPAQVRQLASRQLFSALALPFTAPLPDSECESWPACA